MAIQCDMRADCTNTVTHIGEKGYAYCSDCAPMRRGWERVRKMRAWEVKMLESGQPLPSYTLGPKPTPAANATLATDEELQDERVNLTDDQRAVFDALPTPKE